MTDEKQPRPLRRNDAETEKRRLENARRRGGGAHKREPVHIEWDACIARLKAMLDAIEAK